ncbi:FtsX-like permease family protein [Streptomyces narbonensis]|uniref:FtsX-like permease family protein n=1 Tax=Streptomyces narbonensis TaxID=67333 RepID=UPI001E3E0B76|nr:FtsX-like permease family protein [Streptomyces narbonensis]
MSEVFLLALGQLRRRPAAFSGLAVALFLLIATTTLFGSLAAAEITAPEAVRDTKAAGPGLMVIAGVFGEIAVLVAFFVVVNATGFALRRQLRELALLRTIAATPRQVRRLARVQLLATTLAVAAPGGLAGTAAAHSFLAALRERGMAAPDPAGADDTPPRPDRHGDHPRRRPRGVGRRRPAHLPDRARRRPHRDHHRARPDRCAAPPRRRRRPGGRRRAAAAGRDPAGRRARQGGAGRAVRLAGAAGRGRPHGTARGARPCGRAGRADAAAPARYGLAGWPTPTSVATPTG